MGQICPGPVSPYIKFSHRWVHMLISRSNGMAQETPIDVWNEITISQSGIGVTLYSEYGEGVGAVVEDETWFTFDELEGKAGDIISLNLSEESQSSLVEDGKSLREKVEEAVGVSVSEGDVLVDDNPAPWSRTAHVEVVEVLSDVSADEYIVQGQHEGQVVHPTDQAWTDESVADANPSYPEDDTVIIATYQDSSKRYAFPESRLVEKED